MNKDLRKEKSDDVRILIGDRGWIWIGCYKRQECNDGLPGIEVVLYDAMVIRRWGTTEGLGELKDGPTKETVLDPYGTLRMPELSVIGTMDCNAEKWLKILRK